MFSIVHFKNRCIEIITANQHESGSYVACPNFSTYKYCWLRDGSFIAYSMDVVGQIDSAGRFFDWVDGVITKQLDKIYRIIEMAKRKEPLLNSDFLPTRYNLEGEEAEDEWPNFQLDGYGTWLWALSEHIKITGDTHLPHKYAKSIRASIDYLLNFWDVPNYDCWEENGDKVHPSTLACIYGGLNSIAPYINDATIKSCAADIKKFILHNCIKDGRLTKFMGSDSIDASLLWLTIPFKVFECSDEIMQKTVTEIEKKLLHEGGVHRYPEDTYYGGGEWLLLTCWLGWFYTESGEKRKAAELLAWVERNTCTTGEMPEQILLHVNKSEYIDKWKNLWGEVAVPLLWSHAMYLILHDKLGICA